MATTRRIAPSGPSNVGTKKKNNDRQEMPVNKTGSPRFASVSNRPGVYVGQMKEVGREEFADPMNMGPPSQIGGLGGTYNDIGEMSGFITEGYLDKSNTPYGEAAKFNFLPPGMDISNQENAEINEMPMRKITSESYPGDGWMPVPRDIPE
jgi:hypothetical protein